MKKAGAVILLLTLVMLSSGVYAERYIDFFQDSGFTENILDNLTNFFGAFLGDGLSDEVVYTQFLFFIILLAVIYQAAQNIPIFKDKSGTAMVVAIVVSLLAVRLLNTTEIIRSLLAPYTGLGVAILTLVPFFIFGFLINSFNHRLVKRVGWTLMGVSYFAFFLTSPVGMIGNIYLGAALISLILVFADEKIEDMFAQRRRRQDARGEVDMEISKLHGRIAELRKDRISAADKKPFDDRINRLYEEISELHKNRKTIK